MTLNITVLTKKSIYQSADYRLTDTRAKTAIDFQTQKIFVVGTGAWSATVCFTGIGSTGKIKVHEWVSEQLGLIGHDAPFQRLIDELLKADSWLARVPPPHNRHSFSIGAFLGSRPVFVLISNFERPSGLKLGSPRKQLSVFKQRVKNPAVIVPGQSGAVTRLERKRLITLASQDPAPDLMHSLLAEINRNAATRIHNISPACFTTRLRLTGEGDTRTHDVGNVVLPLALAMPHEMRNVMVRIADEQFGSGRWRINGISFARSATSEDEHQTQLREKPNDPNVHSNYGAFLIDKKGDIEGAEQQYLTALRLDPNHINALGNLANLLAKKGDLHQAANLYRKALETAPGAENVTFNFVNFLMRKLGDRVAARIVLDKGIAANPQSGRLLMLRGQLRLEDGDASKAIEDFQQARGQQADSATVEAGYAYALHLSGASVGDCVVAYRTAIELNPQMGALRLNLAQLLFLQDDGKQARHNLEEALRLGLDDAAQLEASFYRLCHLNADVEKILRETKELLDRGAKLRWNVQPNIELLRRTEPQKANFLERISRVMAGEQDQSKLDELISERQGKRGQ